jgi:hypothetical protein
MTEKRTGTDQPMDEAMDDAMDDATEEPMDVTAELPAEVGMAASDAARNGGAVGAWSASGTGSGRTVRERPTHVRPTRRLRRSRAAIVVVVLAGALATATVARVATAATSAPPRPSVTAATAPGSPAPPAVPATGSYLGAFVAPHLGEVEAQSDARQELAQISNFDGAMGRPLGLVHVYQPWATPVKVSTLAALASTGATPVVDWTCTSDASIASGTQDALITSYATALKGYGRPVFLRWFWEMNLSSLTRAAGCLGTGGATGYIAAWQHIWTIFHNVGATNVAFVWCPSIFSLATTYYPGDSFVDWIGWDGYDRKQDPGMLQSQFLPFYANWVTHGKPMMLGETGATIDQATYIAQLTSTLPVLFPQVHAVLYYDSKSTADWTLVDTPGQLGFTQFVAMGQTAYFGYPFLGT